MKAKKKKVKRIKVKASFPSNRDITFYKKQPTEKEKQLIEDKYKGKVL